MENNNNVIYLANYEKEREIRAYLNLLRLGKIEVINIYDNGVVDVYEFGLKRLGLVFGFDFITFEEKPKIYPINLAYGNDDFYDDDESGVFVVELDEIPKKKFDEYYALVEKNLESFRKIEKMYFEVFLKDDEIKYNQDIEQLKKDDAKYYKNKSADIISFEDGKKMLKDLERKRNIEHVKSLVKGKNK